MSSDLEPPSDGTRAQEESRLVNEDLMAEAEVAIALLAGVGQQLVLALPPPARESEEADQVEDTYHQVDGEVHRELNNVQLVWSRSKRPPFKGRVTGVSTRGRSKIF